MEIQSTIAVLRRRGMRKSYGDKLRRVSLDRLARSVRGDEPDDLALRAAFLKLVANLADLDVVTRCAREQDARP